MVGINLLKPSFESVDSLHFFLFAISILSLFGLHFSLSPLFALGQVGFEFLLSRVTQYMMKIEFNQDNIGIQWQMGLKRHEFAWTAHHNARDKTRACTASS